MTMKLDRATQKLPQTEMVKAKQQEDYLTSNIKDTTSIPIRSLYTAIQGYPLTLIAYYNQSIYKDQDPDGNNIGLHKQYKKINNLDVKLEGQFDRSYDATTGYNSVTGSMTLFAPGLIPIDGDIFLSDMGDGRIGQFQINRPEPLSIFANMAYRADFTWMSIASKGHIDTLNKSVIHESYYVAEFIAAGKNPLLTSKEFNDRRFAKDQGTAFTTGYLSEFYSRVYSTLIVPKQPLASYDPFVVSFLKRLIPTTSARSKIRDIAEYNVDHHRYANHLDIYSVILDQRTEEVPHCFTKAAHVSADSWSSNREHLSIAFTTIPYVVHPTQAAYNVDFDYEEIRSLLDSDQITYQSTSLTYQDIPLLPVLGSGDYVLSQSFYDMDELNDVGLSHLELQLKNYMLNRKVSGDVIRVLLENYPNWSAPERFYYGPLIITLLMVLEFQS